MNIRGNENNDDRLDIPLYSSDDCLYIYILLRHFDEEHVLYHFNPVKQIVIDLYLG
jgi:hypothetical protein